MADRKVVIIGLGTGGIYAAKTVSTYDRNAEITIFERREYPTYSPCGMPYAIGGRTDIENLKHPFPTTKKIKLYLAHEVKNIDVLGRKVVAVSIHEGHEIEEEYDALVYAAGAKPFIPPIVGIESISKLLTLRRLEDAYRIMDKCSTISHDGHLTIVGGGAIGLEVACAIKERWNNLKVTVLEMLDQIMPSLDKDMASILRKDMEKKGLEIKTNVKIAEISEDNSKIRINLGDGAVLSTDAVVMSTGVRPETALLEGKVDMERNFIKVDNKMATTTKDIYAVGDCVIAPTVFGRSMPAQYATAAMKMGIVAGLNICGINAEYSGASFTVTSEIGGIEVASTGLNTEMAKRMNIDINTVKTKHHNKPSWIGGETIVFKLIFTPKGEVVGAQAIGPGATYHINTVSSVIRNKGTLADLLGVENGYCPAISELASVVQMAADMAIRRIKYYESSEKMRI